MQNETLNTKDSADAQAHRGAAISESIGMQGRYEAVLTGPVDGYRDEYARLLSEQAIAKARGIQALVDHYQALIAKIPMEEKWRDTFENVVTTVGKNFALDTILAGSAYTAAWYMGLISITGYVSVPVAADTMASHATWAEDQTYSNATRPAPAFSAAAAGSKTTSSAVSFSINGTTTVKGCFLNTVSTKGGTTGTLLSAGLFTGGDKVVANLDILTVNYTLSA